MAIPVSRLCLSDTGRQAPSMRKPRWVRLMAEGVTRKPGQVGLRRAEPQEEFHARGLWQLPSPVVRSFGLDLKEWVTRDLWWPGFNSWSTTCPAIHRRARRVQTSTG